MGVFSLWHWLIMAIFVVGEYGLAIWLINFIAFREMPPGQRALRLTFTAWLAWSVIFALRAETQFELLALPAAFAVAGLPIGYFVYRRLRRKWVTPERIKNTFE